MKPLDNDKINKSLSKIGRSFKPQPDFEKWCQQNLQTLEALRSQAKKNKKESASPKTQLWRTIMKSKMFKVAAAAVIVITSLVCIQFLTGTSAYAQVAAELRNAHTVVFTIISQANTGSGETIKVDVAYKDPGWLRGTTVDGYVAVVDFTSGKMISIVPGGGYTLAEIKNFKETNKETNTGVFSFHAIEAMKNLPAKADENLGTKEIDGIVCDGYRVAQGDLTTTVWLDTKTGDLVQVEQKYTSAPGMNRIIKNIKFDVELDDSLFSLTPPAGYKSGGFELKSDASAEKEDTFIEFLRWWSNATVDGTFPPIVAGSQMAKVSMDMYRQGKFKESAFGNANADAQRMFNGMLFVVHLPASSNWRYMGENVKYGDAAKAIFWYQPKDSNNYRVIYGDLSVKDVNEADLPK
jgi:outer membrane lipoprotein-sorting protein